MSDLQQYTCAFVGRRAGAIGISTRVAITIWTESPEAARLKCYDTHEHLEGFRCVPTADYLETLGMRS